MVRKDFSYNCCSSMCRFALQCACFIMSVCAIVAFQYWESDFSTNFSLSVCLFFSSCVYSNAYLWTCIRTLFMLPIANSNLLWCVQKSCFNLTPDPRYHMQFISYLEFVCRLRKSDYSYAELANKNVSRTLTTEEQETRWRLYVNAQNEPWWCV